NNLLGGILASAELVLAACAEGSPPDEEALLRIRTSAIRGGGVVGQLMIFNGEGSEGFAALGIFRLVCEKVGLLRGFIFKRALLEVDLPEELPAVRANAAQLRQVVLNLITNASEALGDGDGVISVTASPIRPGRDYSAPGVSRGDYVLLAISDSGCGMTEETQ